MARIQTRQLLGLALVACVLAPAAHAESPAALSSVDNIPVIGTIARITFGMLGAYEDKDQYVSFREANPAAPSVGPHTDTDSAMFAGD